MDDRAKLKAVAKGYHDLEALRKKQRLTTAEMIRACLSQIASREVEVACLRGLPLSAERKRKEGVRHLVALAEMLEKER